MKPRQQSFHGFPYGFGSVVKVHYDIGSIFFLGKLLRDSGFTHATGTFDKQGCGAVFSLFHCNNSSWILRLNNFESFSITNRLKSSDKDTALSSFLKMFLAKIRTFLKMFSAKTCTFLKMFGTYCAYCLLE